jgi:hypothetical protein
MFMRRHRGRLCSALATCRRMSSKGGWGSTTAETPATAFRYSLAMSRGRNYPHQAEPCGRRRGGAWRPSGAVHDLLWVCRPPGAAGVVPRRRGTAAGRRRTSSRVDVEHRAERVPAGCQISWSGAFTREVAADDAGGTGPGSRCWYSAPASRGSTDTSRRYESESSARPSRAAVSAGRAPAASAAPAGPARSRRLRGSGAP